ncbi:ribosome biosynthesis protein [Conglomerata obtusa]
MSDETIWRSIGGKKNFCSFKFHSQTLLLCKNPYNVTNICEQASCPLSNSKYATVREKDNKLFLYMKEPERLKTPKLAYEVVELDLDYNKALLQLDEQLDFFNDFIKHKCKQRLTKLYQYLERKKEPKIQYTVLKKKFERKEKKVAEKVKNKINMMKEVEKELLERMIHGVYGEEVKEILEARVTKKEESIEIKKDKKRKEKKKYVAFFEESDETDNKKNKQKTQLSW